MKKNPDYLVAAHEAGHCVAAYLLHLPLSKVEVWPGEGLSKMASRPSGDPYAHAVSLLAAAEYLRSVGLEPRGSEGDFAKAAILVDMQFPDRGGGKEAFGVACEAARALVRTDRYQSLAAALTPKLAEANWHYGPEVARFLQEADQEPRREAHSLAGPWYTVTSRHGRVLYSGELRAKAYEVLRATPDALLVGSDI